MPVRVAKVEQGEFEVFNKALGSVTPLNTVNLRSRVGGELVELRFEEGQRVKQGDLLAVINRALTRSRCSRQRAPCSRTAPS